MTDQTIFPVPGVRLAAVPAGIRYKDRDDLLLIDNPRRFLGLQAP